jgi:pimeloyl-ACP methyl ester carboxylesterase
VVVERLVDRLAYREWGDRTAPGIVLWPGLGATGAYFAAIAEALPGRGVAVDPPGFGRSPPLDTCTYSGLVDLAAAVVRAFGGCAIVGHSLGAHIAAGVACDPPAGLRAVVLIDGGFMDADRLAEVGMPATSSRAELTAWLGANTPRFPSWDAAITGLAAMIGSQRTPALEAYVRDLFVEVEGEIRDLTPPGRMADLILAVTRQDPRAVARNLRVPTLLIACGKPEEHRATREQAWQAFADACPLIELHVADDWGHNPVLQDPATASSLIAGWLQQHL